MTEYTVSEREEGLTLIKYASRVLKEAPDSLIHKFLRKKNIELNGRKADGRSILTAGDRVSFFLSDETFEKFRGRSPAEAAPAARASRVEDESLEKDRILFEDDDYLFYDKPPAMRTQSDDSGRISLNDRLLRYTGFDGKGACRPSVCNRLDTNTSGIVLCGKSIKGLQALNKAIKEHRIEKYYRALLSGHAENGHLTAYLSSSGNKAKVSVSDEPKPDHKEIVTGIEVIGYGSGISYAELHLITGRKHQIRAHMAHTGHPVIGDMKYTSRGYTSPVKAERQMLHAYRVELPEEILGGLTVSAPIPDDMRKCLKDAGITEV